MCKFVNNHFTGAFEVTNGHRHRSLFANSLADSLYSYNMIVEDGVGNRVSESGEQIQWKLRVEQSIVAVLLVDYCILANS